MEMDFAERLKVIFDGPPDPHYSEAWETMIGVVGCVNETLGKTVMRMEMNPIGWNWDVVLSPLSPFGEFVAFSFKITSVGFPVEFRYGDEFLICNDSSDIENAVLEVFSSTVVNGVLRDI